MPHLRIAAPLAALLTVSLLLGCTGGGGGGDASATSTSSAAATGDVSDASTSKASTSAAESDTASSGETSETGTSTSDGATTAESTSTSDATTSTTTTDATTTDATTMATATTDVITGGGGGMCVTDEECASNSCFLLPLFGGLCGECKVDDDCVDGGCTAPNPFQGVGALCNDGSAGDGCETDAVCSDPDNPHCGVVLDAAPIIEVSTCGACESNADCDAPKGNCSPDVDVSEFSGVMRCVADGSLADGASCSLVEEGGVPLGNAACASGKCGAATLMGVIKVGVCGECLSDADCGGGTCEAGSIDIQSGDLSGATCV